jgi:hypothetical protein
MNENPTAREQFAHDISLVLDNDRASYVAIQAAAKYLNDTYKLAEFIRDYVERSIIGALRQKPSDWTASAGTLLVAQLCTGWGIDAYADYARDIMAELESAGV